MSTAPSWSAQPCFHPDWSTRSWVTNSGCLHCWNWHLKSQLSSAQPAAHCWTNCYYSCSAWTQLAVTSSPCRWGLGSLFDCCLTSCSFRPWNWTRSACRCFPYSSQTASHQLLWASASSALGSFHQPSSSLQRSGAFCSIHCRHRHTRFWLS